MTHIPFKGDPGIAAALLGGHITFAAAGTIAASLVESGQVRLLMMLKEEKSVEYPNVPILKDLGYNIPYPMIMGSIMAPKAVPDAIVKKLDDAVVKVMKDAVHFLRG